jgi:hypothetical protein
MLVKELQGSKLCEKHQETQTFNLDAVETKLQTHSRLHVEDVEKMAQSASHTSKVKG